MKDYTNTNPIYFKALDRMPASFSSHVFMDRLRLFKISEKEIKSGRVIQFLLQNCNRQNRSSWSKKTDSNQIMITQEVIQAPTKNLNEQEMIEHLKGKGYKILKQTWDEL
jgi:hypothetical protein